MIKAYAKRFLICSLGLLLIGLSSALGVKAGTAGTGAWGTLSIGMSKTFGMTYGTATLIVSGLVIVLDIIGKGKLGFGTLLNVLLIPVFSDLFIALFAVIPNATNPFIGLLITLTSLTIGSFATVLYMTPSLGCGPRDTLMILIGQKFPKAPIGTVRFFIEIGALLSGVLLGAPFGIGTVAAIALQATILQFVCRVTHYEPRSIVHEDFLESIKNMSGRK